jgi:hypothetical protein
MIESTDRRASDPKVVEQLEEIRLQIAVVNNTLRNLTWLFVLVFPMCVAWNVYLAKNVTQQEALIQTHQYIIDQHREMLRDQGKSITELQYNPRDVRNTTRF